MRKKCEDCGKFMAKTDYLPYDDEFDTELAYECGLTEEGEYDALFDDSGEWSRFRYVQDVWECRGCGAWEEDHDGPRYYYDHIRNNYFLDAKPLTPKEIAEQARQAQEDAGQMAIAFPGEDGSVKS